jgi:hypothetical protein
MLSPEYEEDFPRILLHSVIHILHLISADAPCTTCAWVQQADSDIEKKYALLPGLSDLAAQQQLM